MHLSWLTEKYYVDEEGSIQTDIVGSVDVKWRWARGNTQKSESGCEWVVGLKWKVKGNGENLFSYCLFHL